ncbi:hypothetical protein QBC34DRAFT_194794 [Podospora aff. communis PSN243]|uniref:Uncharacterized protein n=1 Tax=Podospora aff. communis PSN243 TaxID=3040156 RepID=A0AAV9H0H2_9PEZI|nr:hypothetical protein QBC34DRAFT_194794 [Podospora aff. communis PSN243]
MRRSGWRQVGQRRDHAATRPSCRSSHASDRMSPILATACTSSDRKRCGRKWKVVEVTVRRILAPDQHAFSPSHGAGTRNGTETGLHRRHQRTTARFQSFGFVSAGARLLPDMAADLPFPDPSRPSETRDPYPDFSTTPFVLMGDVNSHALSPVIDQAVGVIRQKGAHMLSANYIAPESSPAAVASNKKQSYIRPAGHSLRRKLGNNTSAGPVLGGGGSL